MKKAIITLIVLALLGGGGYGAYYYYTSTHTEQTRVSSSSDDAVYVETVSSITGYGSGSGVVERFSGEVEAQATLEITLDSDRTLDECYVKEGDIVEEGDKLFSYDTQDDEDQIAQDEIDIEKNEMDIESYETQITQQEKLMNSATTEDDKTEAYLEILSNQNQIRQLEYEIETKKKDIENLKASIADAVVTAEMGGIIQSINDPSTESETYSTSESSAYITILAEGDYRIKGTVNELNVQNIYEGMQLIVYSRVDSSLTWKGSITEISTEQDDSDDEYSYYSSSDTSTYSFYVELDSSEGLLLGQHVYMEEDVGQSEEKTGLWLEEFYIMIEDDGAYVWMANSSNTIEKHEITLGDYDEELCEYEITDGLEADDYIAYPLDTISEGDPVYYFDIAAVGDDDDSDDEYSDSDDYLDEDSDEDLDGMYYDVEDGVYYDLEDDDEDDGYYDEDGVYYDEDDEYYDEDDEYYDEDDEYYDEDDEYYDEDDEDYIDDEIYEE